MASERRNVMVVGDDAQSIYSFRGASFENILTFPLRFPEATIYKLETNYRSTPQILKLANEAIAHNRYQFQKELRPVRGDAQHDRRSGKVRLEIEPRRPLAGENSAVLNRPCDRLPRVVGRFVDRRGVVTADADRRALQMDRSDCNSLYRDRDRGATARQGMAVRTCAGAARWRLSPATPALPHGAGFDKPRSGRVRSSGTRQRSLTGILQ